MKILKPFIALGLVCCVFTTSYAEEKTETKPAPSTQADLNTQLVTIQNRQISLNDVLLAIGRSGEVKVILAPELSGPEQLKKILAMTLGEQKLSVVLDEICKQIGADWKLSPADKTVTVFQKKETPAVKKAPDGDPLKMVIDFESFGNPLKKAAADLTETTGAVIIVPAELENIKIEMSIKNWELKRILDNICFMYDLEYIMGKKGQIIFNKKGADAEK